MQQQQQQQQQQQPQQSPQISAAAPSTLLHPTPYQQQLGASPTGTPAPYTGGQKGGWVHMCLFA